MRALAVRPSRHALKRLARRGRPPTDFAVLRAIRDHHESDYEEQLRTTPARPGVQVFVEIDIPALARELGVSTDILFGRLYYHLEPTYGPDAHLPSDQRRQRFFTLRVGDMTNAINFPLLEAVLAGLWQQQRRELFVVTTSIVSLAIALAALVH